MRYILLIYQNTEACNGLSPEPSTGVWRSRALMHGGGED